MNSRNRRRFGTGTGLGVFAALLACAGIALAALGLQNPSFESDLDNWVAKTKEGDAKSNRTAVYNREVVYGPGGRKGETPPCDETPYGICVVEGTDDFEYYESTFGNWGPKRATVSPTDGSKMLRLGGPFQWSTKFDESGFARHRQAHHDFDAEQTFTVDPENPVVELNYNVFSWEQSRGGDYFSLKATLTDEDGRTISRETEPGPFNPTFGNGLQSTGWQTITVDLSDHANEQVHLRVRNRVRNNYGPTWAYVDAGLIPEPPVKGEETKVEAPELPSGGEVAVNEQVDPASGKKFITVPNSQVSQFASACMPLTVTTQIEPGAGTVSDVKLLLNSKSYPMTNTPGGSKSWAATIDCVKTGELFVEYTLTEDAASQVFVVPIGGIYLIDPQGIVHDKAAFDAAKAGGASDEEAREAAAIEGATVRLQRRTGGKFANVFSGDPGITPNVNPQTTGDDGLYQWDVSAGKYRVKVSKPGYVAVTSRTVDVPPPVLDLHIPMDVYETSIDSGPGGTTTDKTPTFGFSANDPAGSTFECKVDAAPFGSCSGPSAHTTDTLALGTHTFSVRGRDSTGFTDVSPASRTFTVVAPARAPADPGDPGDEPADPGDPGDEPAGPADPGGSGSSGGSGGSGGSGETPASPAGPDACDSSTAEVDAAKAKVKKARKATKRAAKKAKKAKKKAKKAKKKGSAKKAKKAKKKAKKAKQQAKKAKKRLKRAKAALGKAEGQQQEACR